MLKKIRSFFKMQPLICMLFFFASLHSAVCTVDACKISCKNASLSISHDSSCTCECHSIHKSHINTVNAALSTSLQNYKFVSRASQAPIFALTRSILAGISSNPGYPNIYFASPTPALRI